MTLHEEYEKYKSGRIKAKSEYVYFDRWLEIEVTTLRARIAALQEAGDALANRFSADEQDTVRCIHCGCVQPIMATDYIHASDCPVTKWQEVKQ